MLDFQRNQGVVGFSPLDLPAFRRPTLVKTFVEGFSMAAKTRWIIPKPWTEKRILREVSAFSAHEQDAKMKE